MVLNFFKFGFFKSLLSSSKSKELILDWSMSATVLNRRDKKNSILLFLELSLISLSMRWMKPRARSCRSWDSSFLILASIYLRSISFLLIILFGLFLSRYLLYLNVSFLSMYECLWMYRNRFVMNFCISLTWFSLSSGFSFSNFMSFFSYWNEGWPNFSPSVTTFLHSLVSSSDYYVLSLYR